ncbi:MAG: protein phosphatase 2C domain-containing protein [Planctomycetota bacterium]|nr:protein phosphatase 2C domain-containing protein [Planctomycetota bacterium]
MTGHSESAPQLRITWYGRTVVGKVRTNNEDSLWAAPVADQAAREGDSDGADEVAWPGVLLAVADGMGGALAGEVASSLAVETIAEELRREIAEGGLEATSAPELLRDALVRAVERANQRIRKEGEKNPQQRGMGTTLTVIWAHGAGHGEVAQVGDSRLYVFRGGHLTQLTKDQSLVGKLIEDGIITEDEAERIAGRNIILQALGSEEELEVVHQREGLQAGDLLLLCTDGLSGVVNNTDLEAELRRGGNPHEICARLIALAEQRGGPDNITVLLGKVEKV